MIVQGESNAMKAMYKRLNLENTTVKGGTTDQDWESWGWDFVCGTCMERLSSLSVFSSLFTMMQGGISFLPERQAITSTLGVCLWSYLFFSAINCYYNTSNA